MRNTCETSETCEREFWLISVWPQAGKRELFANIQTSLCQFHIILCFGHNPLAYYVWGIVISVHQHQKHLVSRQNAVVFFNENLELCLSCAFWYFWFHYFCFVFPHRNVYYSFDSNFCLANISLFSLALPTPTHTSIRSWPQSLLWWLQMICSFRFCGCRADMWSQTSTWITVDLWITRVKGVTEKSKFNWIEFQQIIK